MIKALFLIWLLLFKNIISAPYVSNFIHRHRQKPQRRSSYILDNFSFRKFAKETRVIPLNDSTEEQADYDLELIKYEQINILTLPDVLIQEIFEYIQSDYSSIKQVCKDFANLFDQTSFRIAWQNFPNGTPKTFEKYSEYKLIRLAPILSKSSKLFQQIPKDLSLYETVFEVIKQLRIFHKNEAFIAVSFFLKLEIISWSDFSTANIGDFLLAWSLGLLTIAKFLVNTRLDLFLFSMRHEQHGIVIALENDRKALALYMFELVKLVDKSIISSHPGYLDKIIKTCIKKRNWEFLGLIYFYNREVDYKVYLKDIARMGSVEGLMIFKEVACRNPEKLAHYAADYGHLDFLKKLDEFGILLQSADTDETGETAVHIAAFRGKTDCLIFLVERLRKRADFLNVTEKDGNLPLHLAANYGNTETLLEIIKRNPRYKSRNFFKEIISPLHNSVVCCQIESVNILLSAFPELIKFKDSDGNTAIHLAVGNSSIEILSLLLDFAPFETIKSKNLKGNTALHLAAKNGQMEKLAILLSSKCFTGTERNFDGYTPITLLARKYPNFSVQKFRELFGISVGDLDDALRWKRPNCFF